MRKKDGKKKVEMALHMAARRQSRANNKILHINSNFLTNNRVINGSIET